MHTLTWRSWLVVVVVAVVVAVGTFVGLLEFQHLKQDEANLHAIIPLLNFNLAKGHLELPPDGLNTGAVPPIAPTPPSVKPPDKKP